MPFLRKYNTLLVTGTTSIRIPIIKRAVVDFALGADWTPAAGDVKVFVDAAAAANITNLPTAIASGNAAFWEFILTGAELTCQQLLVVVSDAATKVIEDQSFIVETYGNASARYQADLSLPNLPANVTQWLGTAAATPTVAGVPEVDITHFNGTAGTFAAGRAEVNVSHWLGTAAAAPTVAGVPEVDVTHWIGTAAATPTVAGVPEVDTTHWNGTAVSTPATAGIPEVNLKNIVNVAVSTTTAQLGVNIVQISTDAVAADNLEQAFDDTAGAAAWTGVIDQGTAQSATGTTLVLRAAAAFIADELIGATILIVSATAGAGQTRVITDYGSVADTATVDTWTTTPTGTIVYKVFATASLPTGLPTAVNLTQILGTAVSTPATAGILDVNVKNIDNDAASASGVVTFPAATLASTTNITAGTITTTTNLTNLPAITANWLTATGINADAITAAKIADDVSTEIANKVWDTDATGRQTAGTFGQAIGDPGADANTIFKAVVTDATGATIGVDIVEIETQTDDIGVAGAGLTAINLPDQTMNITGDITGNLSGSVGSVTGAVTVGTINANVITATSINADAITAAKVADGTIDAATFAAGAITATVIATGAINANALATDAVTEIKSIVTGTADSGSTTTVVDTERTEADTDYWKDMAILFRSGAAVGQARLITAFNFTTDTITFTPATTQAIVVGDTYSIIANVAAAGAAAPSAEDVATAVWNRDATSNQTLGTFGQAIGDPVADTNTIYKAVVTDAAGATVGVDVVAVQADTDNIQTRLPAALVSGRIDASVGAMAVDTLTASALAGDAATEIANAVWDTDATGRQTLGTFGQAIGDPVADTNTIYKAVVTDAAGATIGVDIVEIESQTDDIGVAGAGLTAIDLPDQTMNITGNITGNVSGSVGSVTGAVTVGTINANVITATSIAADAITDAKVAADVTIASVTGAVGSVTGAVGSVIAGVTVAVGGIGSTSFAAGAIDSAAIAADAIGASELAADAIGASEFSQAAANKVFGASGAVLPELAAAIPSATPRPDEALMLLYMAMRNASQSTSTQRRILNDAGAVIAKATMSDDGTTFTQGELIAGP